VAKRPLILNLTSYGIAKHYTDELLKDGSDFKMKHLPELGYIQLQYPDTEKAKDAVQRIQDRLRSNPYQEDPAQTMHKAIVALSLKLGFGDPGRQYPTDNVNAICARLAEEFQNVQGPFEKCTVLATELKLDVDWLRQMWATDRQSVLENALFWKRQYEQLVEDSLRGGGKIELTKEMKRPSDRKLVEDTREAILKSVSDAARRGEVTFEVDVRDEARVSLKKEK
jgi:hypothetical protein